MDEAQPRFGAWAALYHRYRPGYPPALFETLAEAVGPNRSCCVELGAGSGQATCGLLALFDQVIAVEPDPVMAALMPERPCLEVRTERAEQAVFAPATVDAVVIATAFHWMDQPQVARIAARWLKPGGIFFTFALGKPQYPQASTPALHLLQRHQTAARPHMHDRIASWRPYRDILVETQVFEGVRSFELYVEHRWTALETAGFLTSTSFGHALAHAAGGVETYQSTLARDLDRANGGRDLAVRFAIEGAYGFCAKSARASDA